MRRNSCPWEKKGFHKKKKKHKKLFQLPTISNCPDLCPLTHIECWRTTELLLLPRTPSLSLERSVSRALSLCLDLFLLFYLPLVLIVLVFFGRFFFFFFSVKQRVREMAPIAVGDKLPDGTLFYLNSDGKPTAFPVYESLKGKKVVLVAAPGAFTPTCRLDQLPSLSCAVLCSLHSCCIYVFILFVCEFSSSFVCEMTMLVWRAEIAIGRCSLFVAYEAMEMSILFSWSNDQRRYVCVHFLKDLHCRLGIGSSRPCFASFRVFVVCLLLIWMHRVMVCSLWNHFQAVFDVSCLISIISPSCSVSYS